MKTKVGIIDYKSGNYTSVWSAFEKHNCALKVITEPNHFNSCTHLVLPGVGSFSSSMNKLEQLGLVEPLQKIISGKEVPILGICVGMQLLAESGDEFTYTEGFNAVDGRVIKFDLKMGRDQMLLPHIGWNDIVPHKESRLFFDLDLTDPSFYFVHSFFMKSHDDLALFSYANYGYDFIAAFEKDNVYGVQFHPEKSQSNGFRVIRNFLNIK
jgi:imidazole glycerol-phosphate synthase subunit HisH